MDKRLIIIPVILFASVLLFSGLMNGNPPVPEADATDGAVIEKTPGPEVQNAVANDDSGNAQEDVPEEEEGKELAPRGMGGGSASFSGGVSASAKTQDDAGNNDDKKNTTDKKQDEMGNVTQGDDDTGNITQDNGDQTGNISDNEQCQPEEIPEFPTVALPMLAILGLAFVFRRK